MKKILYFILVPAISLGSLSSCQNLLDIEETDFLGGETALRTVKNNESLVLGAYAGFGTEMGIRLNGVFSDELKVGEFYNAQTTHEWQYASNDIGIRDSYTATTPYYRVIDRANRVLTALPDAIVESESDEALKARIEGEAKFLRAYSHFELFRYYCQNYDPSGLGMMFMETPTLQPQARIQMDDYFNNILNDINDAKSLLPNNLTDVNRATRLAAVGLHARVALYMRNWEVAAAQATEYINGLPLASKDDFPKIWTDESNAEVAFRLARNNSNRIGGIYRGTFTRNAAGELVAPATISWVPSTKLWDSFDEANDIRFAAYLIDEPILAAVTGKPSKIVHKYAGTGYATANENVANLKIFRTAEMYLIRAEARAELNSVTGANSAESDINALRAARINGYTNITFTGKDQAITEILQERFKELAFEGHRFWDLKRRGLPVTRTGDDAPSSQGATLSAGNFRFTLPIPEPEIQANPLIVQNEGYAN